MRDTPHRIRRAAVAGSWYPGSPQALAAAVDRYLADAQSLMDTPRDVAGELVALVAPHAGLVYSGPVAAHAYRLLRDRRFDVAVLVGPSHLVDRGDTKRCFESPGSVDRDAIEPDEV